MYINTYTHMFPVNVIWGHRWGLHITATTAIPEAVRIGLACLDKSQKVKQRGQRSIVSTFNFGNSTFLCVGGTPAMISTNLGCVERPFLLAISPFSLNNLWRWLYRIVIYLFKLISLPFSWASISLFTISDTVIIIRSALDAWGT